MSGKDVYLLFHLIIKICLQFVTMIAKASQYEKKEYFVPLADNFFKAGSSCIFVIIKLVQFLLTENEQKHWNNNRILKAFRIITRIEKIFFEEILPVTWNNYLKYLNLFHQKYLIQRFSRTLLPRRMWNFFSVIKFLFKYLIAFIYGLDKTMLFYKLLYSVFKFAVSSYYDLPPYLHLPTRWFKQPPIHTAFYSSSHCLLAHAPTLLPKLQSPKPPMSS